MSNLKSRLLDKIHSKNAVIGVVGLGYVGLPLVLRFAEAGYRVLGFDIDARKVELLKAGKSYIEHIPSQKIAETLADGFDCTTDFDASARSTR